jgi:hypothetical protein
MGFVGNGILVRGEAMTSGEVGSYLPTHAPSARMNGAPGKGKKADPCGMTARKATAKAKADSQRE